MGNNNGTANSAGSGISGLSGNITESMVLGLTSQGAEIHATLLRLNRFAATFEVYSPGVVLRASEVLGNFKVVFRDRTVYSGRAVVRSLIETGLAVICEVTLNEGSWMDVTFALDMIGRGKLRDDFSDFMRSWQKLYRVLPEYKVIIADMHSFLSDLRLWLDQVELGIRSSPGGDRIRLEQEATDELAGPILPCVDELFERFERVAESIEEEFLPAHWTYMRRQLHPLVLSAPFPYRAFSKPLGYAGDYEVVNMMARNSHEGGSLFAKIVHTWFLRQPPAQAHRNRIQQLSRWLEVETLRASRSGRRARILNVACGPAQEIQQFLAQSPLSDHAGFTLIDFNQETLDYTQATLNDLRNRHSRDLPVEYVRKSVHQILKEAGRPIPLARDRQYDFVYCAGLFDYLSDQVCHRLMDIMYEWVAPDGVMAVTNVEPSNPLRNGMDHLLDWHLIYRTGPELEKLRPSKADREVCRVSSDTTGVNVFLEVRKPAHA
jgi:extracellular factor (EF) 3-hydroxypalmitic acid methyl ester biosynthesis protein